MTGGFNVGDFDGGTSFRRDGQADCDKDLLRFFWSDGFVFHGDDRLGHAWNPV
jgi:hypothetical protein